MDPTEAGHPSKIHEPLIGIQSLPVQFRGLDGGDTHQTIQNTGLPWARSRPRGCWWAAISRREYTGFG